MDVVARDEFESGERKKLNFGHTIGHAIESHLLETENPVLHGEAIAAGMIMESFISTKLVRLSEAELKKILQLTDSIFSRVSLSKTEWVEVKKLLIHDKKNTNGQVRFVLLKSIGEATIDQPVSEELLDQAFEFYISHK